MRGMLTKDLEIMKGNIRTFAAVYVIALVCFLGTSAGPSFLISYVSILAAIMALNTITIDDTDNGMAYIFTLPVSRRAYVKEKYLFGTGMIAVLWLAAVVIACAVNAAGFRTVPWEELIASGAAGIFVAALAETILFPVQMKYGSGTGRLVLFVLVFGIMAVAWMGKEICERMHIEFTAVKDLGMRILALGTPVCIVLLCVLMLLLLLVSCTISIKIMEKKEY